jgi:hypothetical protein
MATRARKNTEMKWKTSDKETYKKNTYLITTLALNSLTALIKG